DEVAAVGRFRAGTGETLVFDAAWIQQGGFDAGVAVTGQIVTGVGGDSFTIAPDPGEAGSTHPFTGRVLPGAQLFNRAGGALAPGDLVPGRRVRAFGVLAGSAPQHLDASLVFVREHEGTALLHGTVLAPFDAAAGTLSVQAVTRTSVGPACVAIGADDAV